MKENIKQSLFMALCLILFFTIRSIYPSIILSQTITFLIQIIFIGVCITFAFHSSEELETKYGKQVKRGCVIGLQAGFITAVFIYCYTNYIDVYYFENLAKSQLQSYAQAYKIDEYAESQFLQGVGVMKRFNALSIGTFVSTTLYSIALSMIIAPFYLQKNETYHVSQ